MRKEFILIILTLLLPISANCQLLNNIHGSLGTYFFPKSDVGLKEEGLGFYPVSIKNNPGLFAKIQLNKKWDNGIFFGIELAGRTEGFDLDRNYFTPLTNVPVLENSNFKFRFTSFGYGFNGGLLFNKWRFSTSVLFNLTSTLKETPNYTSNRGGNIYSEIGELDGELVLLLLIYEDYTDGISFGPNYVTQEISISRKISPRILLSLSFEFQYPSDITTYRYTANGGNYAMDTEETIYFNRTSFQRKMEVLKVGVSYDLYWKRKD